MLNYLYTELARRRRHWYAQHPEARRRLARPVISAGNLTAGGNEKTPLVAHLARLLLAAGERPAILSRGYARQVVEDGVVVVRDHDRIWADLARAGDEPLMLARALEGTVVLASPDRYLAGRLAELRLQRTVHLLDDGFQHLVLERDLDLVLIDSELVSCTGSTGGSNGSVSSPWLREPLDTASLADALILTSGTDDAVQQAKERFQVPEVFRTRRALECPRLVEPYGRPVEVDPALRVLAVAGIARPDRFFADLRSAGWTVARELAFRDHHPYRRRDIEDILQHAAALGAGLILTTEKDIVRFLPHRPIAAALAWVPLSVTVEPAEQFAAWIQERLAGIRNRRVDGRGRGADASPSPVAGAAFRVASRSLG